MTDAKAAPGDPPETATNTQSPDSVTRASDIFGLPLPAPDRSDDFLIGFAQGFVAGWRHGGREGFAAGYRVADEVLKGAITAALGQSGDDYTAAVRRSNRRMAVVAYRRRFDARDREVA